MSSEFNLSSLSLDEPPKPFHPLFSALDTDRIFQSNDGTRFRFSLPLLTQLSSFFANISTLGAVDPNILSIDNVIELPSATTSGLALAFNIIRDSLDGRDTTLPKVTLVAHVIQALEVAEAYDLPVVAKIIVHQIVIEYSDDPFLVFTIAAIAKNEKVAAFASRLTLPLDIDGIPHNVAVILSNHAPMYHIRLRELHLTRQRTYKQLRNLLALYQAIPDRQDFVKACSKSGGCATYVMVGGNFSDLREKVAIVVYDMFVAMGGLGMDAIMNTMVGRMVPCEKCAGRITKCFANAFWTYGRKITKKDTI